MNKEKLVPTFNTSIKVKSVFDDITNKSERLSVINI